ncbi:MAG: hypothetical protein L3J93_02790 [Thermoplasmata archaeon]|nr:hypothetical protein [Thermoplasmata archaeon]
MRALTDAEAKTIAVLLGSAASPERVRLQRCGLPRSTYHAARRRAYTEGWLRDRYVPEPERFGLRWATFLVARPFADRVEELSRRWSAHEGTTLLLVSPRAVIGVFLARTESAAREMARGSGWGELASSSTSLVADLQGPSVPVYFDFEGLWSHLAGIEGTVTYPMGLGGSAPAENDVPLPSEHQKWAAGELAYRPFADSSPAALGRLVGPLGLPFSQQRLVALGWVNHRVFLDPSRLSAYRGNAADLYVFISGSLLPGIRPEVVFQTLVRECEVFPFLYVVGDGRLLIGAMGASRPPRPGARAGPARTQPVMPTLQKSITGIELLQEPASGFAVAVDHRYDRVAPRRSATQKVSPAA